MNAMLYDTSKDTLDEKTKTQIATLVHIMQELDETGRMLMENTAWVIKIKSDLDRAGKESRGE